MTLPPLRSLIWDRLLPGVAAVVLAWVSAYAALFYLDRYDSWPWAALLIGLLVFLPFRAGVLPLERIPRPVFLGAVLVLFLVSRLIWIQIVPSQPVSDFQSYDTLAKSYALSDPPVSQLPWQYQSYAQGYPLALGGLYRLLGYNHTAAKVLNLLLGAGSLLLIYFLGRRFGERTARAAALLFLLWPAQLTYSSVLASEHLALLLFLGALAFLFPVVEAERGGKAALAGGGLLALAYLARGPLGLALAAALVLIFGTQPVRSGLPRAGGLLAGFLGVFLLALVGMKLAFGIAPLGPGFITLLTGTNFASQGGWNAKDGAAYLAHTTRAEADEYALDTALERIRSNPRRYAKLVLLKLPRTWQEESYGLYWSTYGLDDFPFRERLLVSRRTFLAGAQSYHLIVLVLALAGTAQAAVAGRTGPSQRLIFLLFLGTVLFHSIFEAQSRYNYWIMPLLILQAAMFLAEGRKR
jgi:4-amino-4-deoxy-L-arabinose transferase-like glycosyltransferase